VPPEAARVAAYRLPWVASGSDSVVIASGDGVGVGSSAGSPASPTTTVLTTLKPYLVVALTAKRSEARLAKRLGQPAAKAAHGR